GFNIPGTEDQIIVTLFTNNITVFIVQYDDLDKLTKILDSGAKFNIDKTEILLIDTPSHCDAIYHH
ncbi:uncharacterized protein BT62DRAFT_881804, partial [Guyanagaster necrorhizus]